MGAIFGGGGGGGSAPAPLPVPVQKPISPVRNQATVEGTVRAQRRRTSLANTSNRSLLNDETQPLGV